MTEREITEPTDLCDERGRLDPAAPGWSRHPLHRANLSGARGRKKRWDYWCVTSPDVYVSLTYADVDYLGTASLWVHEPASGLEASIDRIVPFGRGFSLPDEPCTGHMVADVSGLHVEIDERPDATHLVASGSTKEGLRIEIDVTVDKPAEHESLNVVIPWSATRFQYTSKQNTRPATGTVRIGDRTHRLDETNPAYGTLDLGRGIWRYRNQWNWAAASGTSGGRLVGLQFGGKWTEGTGHTENGICIDGRLSKIHDELQWDYDWDQPLHPWRVSGAEGRIDATLTPTHDRHSRTSLGVLSMEVHQCFGTWAGAVVTGAGERIEFDGIIGFAEEARNRW